MASRPVDHRRVRSQLNVTVTARRHLNATSVPSATTASRPRAVLSSTSPVVRNVNSHVRTSTSRSTSATLHPPATSRGRMLPTANIVARSNRSAVTSVSSSGVRAPISNSSSGQKVKPVRRSARLQLSENPRGTLSTAAMATPPSNHPTSHGRRESSPGENVFYCPICFENVKNIGGRIAALPCGHVFCVDCILVTFQKKKDCPLCQVAYMDTSCLMEIFL